MRPLSILGMSALFAILLIAPEAEAQIFKFKKKDGTVVYTDSLSKLPPARRAYYNKKLQAREQKRQEAIERLGKERYEQEEKEKQLAALREQQLDEAERQRRAAALNAAIEAIRQRKKNRNAQKSQWQDKAKQARENVDKLLKEFNELQEKYKSLATKANFALLPGQGKELEELRKKLPKKEAELDAAIEYKEFELPEEARKAGIPPGWLR